MSAAGLGPGGARAGARLGVALTGHHLPLAATLRLAACADAAGFEAIVVDGDEARVAKRPEAELYDGTALCAGVLHHTSHIRAASIRLPGYANVTQTARALATLQRLGRGRAFGFFGVGSGRHVADLGVPAWSPGERLAALDETLAVLRELWTGTPVDVSGRFHRLHAITAPPARVPVVVAAAGPRALRVVDRHADVWDANVPALRRCLEPLRARLTRELETWLWIFARPGANEAEAAAQFRRHCPWFSPLAPEEYRACLLFGDPRGWPERLERLRAELGIDLPVLDLIGLPEASARLAIEACGPARAAPMA